jgi:hypothetical protein
MTERAVAARASGSGYGGGQGRAAAAQARAGGPVVRWRPWTRWSPGARQRTAREIGKCKLRRRSSGSSRFFAKLSPVPKGSSGPQRTGAGLSRVQVPERLAVRRRQTGFGSTLSGVWPDLGRVSGIRTTGARTSRHQSCLRWQASCCVGLRMPLPGTARVAPHHQPADTSDGCAGGTKLRTREPTHLLSLRSTHESLVAPEQEQVR